MNRLEMLNEFIVASSTLFIIYFATNPEERDKYNHGWVMFGIICILLVVNVLIILFHSNKAIKLIIIKYYR